MASQCGQGTWPGSRVAFAAPEDSLQALAGVSSATRPPSLARYFILNLYGDLYALYEKTSQLKKTGPMKKSGNAC